MPDTNDPELVTWTLSVDRRKADREALEDELASLGGTIQGLDIELLPVDEYEAAADGGAFRDFVAFARLSHPQKEALDYVAEELLEAFGWLVDFRPPEQEPDHE